MIRRREAAHRAHQHHPLDAQIQDAGALRATLVDRLVATAVFADGAARDAARWIIRLAAAELVAVEGVDLVEQLGRAPCVEREEHDAEQEDDDEHAAPQRLAQGVAGDDEGATRAYRLLLGVMEQTDHAALGRFVMRAKEQLAIVRARDGALSLTTMRFHDEVRAIKDVPSADGKSAKPSKKELDAAGAFNEPIVTEIAPAQHFYPAGEEDQNFYNLNPEQPYCQRVITPKLLKLKRVFREKFKAVA